MIILSRISISAIRKRSTHLRERNNKVNQKYSNQFLLKRNIHGCLQSSPPNPGGQLHLPLYSLQFAKCKHSKPGSMQLKHGGQSLSSPRRGAIEEEEEVYGV